MAAPAARQFSRAVTTALLQVWLISPWALFAWLGMVIACRRWSGGELVLSLGITAAGAAAGWQFINRLGHRLHDVQLGDLLMAVGDPPLWDLSPHPVQLIKSAHVTHCRCRWGVTPRTSGWELFRRAWWQDVAGILCGFAVSVHPWWVGL